MKENDFEDRCPNCGSTEWHVRKRYNQDKGKLEYMVDCEDCPNNTDWMEKEVRAVICFLEGRKNDNQKPGNVEVREGDEDPSLSDMWRIRRR